MKALILMGSPRLHGNTAELLRPFREELERGGARALARELLETQAC